MKKATPRPGVGGKRPGSGSKKGQVYAPTLTKQKHLDQFRAFFAQQLAPLFQAQLDAALGVKHMMARQSNGQWIEVTNPKVMAKVLDSGEAFYKIYANNPDPRMLKDIMDRMMGQPSQELEVEHSGGLTIRHELPE